MFTESPQKIDEYGRAAMERMAREGIPASPENYSVWYTYFCGKNPALIRAIEVLDSNSQAITETLSGELYQKYLSPDPAQQAINEIGDRIQSSLETVIGAIETSSAGADAYGRKLADVSSTLQSGSVGIDQLQGLIEAIGSDTQAMADQNRELEGKLKQSSEQMDAMQQELQAAQREAMTDGLTGIPNRKYFDLQLKQTVIEAMESGQPMSLLMLDIDHFKKFNDDHGHQVGDEVLKLVARVLQTSIKGQDIAARFGGEEFSIILPNTPLKNAIAVGDHIRKSLAVRRIVRRNSGKPVGNITLSAGAAEFAPGEAVSNLVKRADSALYRAKEAGRNRVVADVAEQPTAAAAAG
ncbi:MAG: GGDEF domain-containing protein [Inquilinus sp.]|nr:GGDEF domain-containing protein [Inquilinus sp.]